MEFVSPVLRWHMFIFRAIGYCTLPPSGNKKMERFLISWSLIVVIFFNILAFHSMFIDDDYLFSSDKFGYFSDILMFSCADIAVTSSYITAIWKRSSAHEFWKCYKKLQKNSKIKSQISWRNDIWQNRRFLSIFYAFIICESTMRICFTSFQNLPPRLFAFHWLFTPFVCAVHLRNLQTVLYMEVMRLELEKIKQDMQHLVVYSKFQAYGKGFQSFEDFLCSKILDNQKNYQLIFEMYEHFQNSFGLSIITVLGMIYVRVLGVLYFSYYGYYAGKTNAGEFVVEGPLRMEMLISQKFLVLILLLLIPAFLHIPTFLITSKNCMEVVKCITLSLHSIISQFSIQSTLVTIQVQNFSLQICHQNICINGIGISRMDGYMLVKIIYSITTYMIFFIQFMPIFSRFNREK